MNAEAPVEQTVQPLDPAKFRDPHRTATGAERASVTFRGLETLWFNTGTLCNIECAGCYIESSPRNDRLVYLTLADVAGYLDEIARESLPTREIGFTGGEPFMNSQIMAMLTMVLNRGFHVLVLTNAMKPMMRHSQALLELQQAHGNRLTLRISMDHPTRHDHEAIRGPRSWSPMIEGARWLAANGFAVHVAGRNPRGQCEAELRAGYAALFRDLGLATDAADPVQLMLFPEMDATRDVPEITTGCWGILGRTPDSLMCASSRMVVRRKSSARAAVVACTLLPYDSRFELGHSLMDAAGTVKLNHPHCARFCVLGGGACSG